MDSSRDRILNNLEQKNINKSNIIMSLKSIAHLTSLWYLW